MKDKLSKILSVCIVIGIVFIFLCITLNGELGILINYMFFNKEEPLTTLSTVCGFIGGVLCIFAVGTAIVKNKANPDSSNTKDPRLNHKGIDKTKKFATGEFVSAQKDVDGKYSIRYEYTNDFSEEKQEESKAIYSYIDAKYFQKVKRFTVCFDATGSYIYDEPRPGMIPELANAPLVPNEKVKPIGTKEDAKSKQVKTKKQEEYLVRLFCSYCDCAIKPNSTKCPHCSAPIIKLK